MNASKNQFPNTKVKLLISIIFIKTNILEEKVEMKLQAHFDGSKFFK